VAGAADESVNGVYVLSGMDDERSGGTPRPIYRRRGGAADCRIQWSSQARHQPHP